MKLKLRVKTRILVTKTPKSTEFNDVQMVESSPLSADVSDKKFRIVMTKTCQPFSLVIKLHNR